MPYDFEYPAYGEALKQYEVGLGDWRARALSDMMERQAAQGTLRAGGITDYPTLDIERQYGTNLANFRGQLSQQEAATKIARENAEIAYQRQIDMFNRQIEAQRQLMREQYEMQKQAQGEMFWQNLGQNVLGTLAGTLVGAPLGALGAGLGGLFSGAMTTDFLNDLGMKNFNIPATGWGQGLWRYQMQQMGLDPFTLALYNRLLTQSAPRQVAGTNLK